MLDTLQLLAKTSATIADPETEMRYGELQAAVAQVTGALEVLGVVAADCLAFACGNDVPSAIVLLALLSVGQTFVVLPSAAFPADRVTDAVLPYTFCRHSLQLCRRENSAGVAIAAMPGLSILLTANLAWQANLERGPARFLIPTSGSTARARLVQHRRDSLLLAARRCSERLRLTASDRVAIPVPIAHMFGLGAAFLPAVLAGASIDLQPDANVLRYFARERHFDPTVTFLAPSFGEALVRLRKAPRKYRLTIMAGDRVTADLFDRYERLHGCLVSLYGSTELGVVAAGDPTDHAPLRRGVIGRPMPGVSIAANAGGAAGTTDLLWLQSDTGFMGYLDDRGHALQEADGTFASAESFGSSDFGQMLDGHLTVIGRSDDLVKRDGMLTACSDVAAALLAIGGIVDAVVLSGAASPRGRMLIAFCVASPEGHWESGALRKACLNRLPSRSIPDVFVFLPELPRLPSGKVDRLDLRRRHIPEESKPDAEPRQESGRDTGPAEGTGRRPRYPA